MYVPAMMKYGVSSISGCAGVWVERLNMTDFDFHQIRRTVECENYIFRTRMGCSPFFSAKNEIFALLGVRESNTDKISVVLFMMKL